MQLKNIALVTAAAILSGCTGGKYISANANKGALGHDFSYYNTIDMGYDSPRFRNTDELREYLEIGVDTLIPKIVKFYNEKFGGDISSDSVGIDYDNFWMFAGGMPSFRHDYDDHRLKLEFVPRKESDGYVKEISRNKELWREYEAATIGLLPHEVAHWYHDMLLGDKNDAFSGITFSKETRDVDILKCMIIEGVATYMASSLDNDETYVNRGEFGSPIDSLKEGGPTYLWIYPAGEELMKPILDKDFKNGIALTSRDFPRLETAEEVNAYQAEILKKLDELKNE